MLAQARPDSVCFSASHQTGLTLVDLVLTVMIVGILAAVTTPRFVEALQQQRVQSAATRLKTDLEFAARHARSTGVSETISFNTTDNSYTFSSLKDINHPSQTYTVWLVNSPYYSSVQSLSLGAGTAVTFNAFGIPDVSGQIVLESSGYTETVVLDAITGRATVLP